MKLVSLLKNKVTKQAILFTLLIFIVYRIGSNVVTPGVNINFIEQSGSIFGTTVDSLFAFFGGGKLSTFSIFMLGVSPYITASIVIQLLESDLVPSMGEWKKQGVDGENKRANWTKRLAIILGFLQAFGLVLIAQFKLTGQLNLLKLTETGLNLNELSNIQSVILETSKYPIFDFIFVATVITAGVAAMVWLADRITENGIGNGVSVIIMANIVASLPLTFNQIYTNYFSEAAVASGSIATNSIIWLIILILQILLIIAVIYYTLASRKIPINYVRSSKGKLNDQSYLPVKLNPAGVIPVIFVAPLMAFPSIIIAIKETVTGVDNGVGWIENTVNILFNYRSTSETWFIALFVYMGLIVLFSIFYSFVQMDPETMAENLEKQGAYVVGVRSGEDTEKYFEKVIIRTTLYGGLMLAVIASMPIIIQHVFGVTNVSLSLLGTGIIIVVNVIIQTYEALLNKLETKKYRKLFGGDQ